MSSRDHVQKNLETLLKAAGENPTSLQKRTGIPKSNTQEVLRTGRDPATKFLDDIAKAYDIEPWRLLTPNLGQGVSMAQELDADRIARILSAVRDTLGLGEPVQETAEYVAFFYQQSQSEAPQALRNALAAVKRFRGQPSK